VLRRCRRASARRSATGKAISQQATLAVGIIGKYVWHRRYGRCASRNRARGSGGTLEHWSGEMRLSGALRSVRRTRLIGASPSVSLRFVGRRPIVTALKAPVQIGTLIVLENWLRMAARPAAAGVYR